MAENFSAYNLSNLTGSPELFRWNDTPLNFSLNITEHLNWAMNLTNFSNAMILKPVEKILILDTSGFGLIAILFSFIGMVYMKTKRLEAVAAVALLLASGLTIAGLKYPIVRPIHVLLMWTFVLALAGVLYYLYKERW